MKYTWQGKADYESLQIHAGSHPLSLELCVVSHKLNCSSSSASLSGILSEAPSVAPRCRQGTAQALASPAREPRRGPAERAANDASSRPRHTVLTASLQRTRRSARRPAGSPSGPARSHLLRRRHGGAALSRSYFVRLSSLQADYSHQHTSVLPFFAV